jgi:signal transduction histidine kinase
MKNDLQNLSIRELQEISEDLYISANNLFGLLTNLLEWSMIQRGAKDFNPENLSVKATAQENIAILTDTAQNKGINIVEYISEELFVTADKQMLDTVFRNFISNAIKFSWKGGHVKISAEKVNDKIQISVTDTGMGMSKNLVDDLFKLDKRTNRTGTEGEPSTGLGLLLCKEIVEKHCGKIIVTSEKDKGTEFVFSMPCGEIAE